MGTSTSTLSMHDALLQEQQSLDMTQDFLSIKCKLTECVQRKSPAKWN